MRRITVLLIALLLAGSLLAAGCSTEGQDKPSGDDGAGIPTPPVSTSPDPAGEKTLNLVGNKWRLEAIVDGTDTSKLPAKATATIVFRKKWVQTHSGCNSAGGKVKIADDTLAFGPLWTTLIACPEKWKRQAETAYDEVLRGKATYVIEGSRLTITKGDSSLEFVAR